MTRRHHGKSQRSHLACPARYAAAIVTLIIGDAAQFWTRMYGHC
jgi:hypothetical protein